ncbi:MAG: hypothetical protein ABI845_01565, partial [Polaromonas sp.]
MSNKVTKKFHAELLRVDDLLHLLVDGSNLRLSPDGNRGSFLSIEDPALPGYLRFTFAPQTIAETAVFEASIVAPESDPKRPDPDQTKNTPTEPLSTPGTPGLNAKSVARIGHPSRLVFIVPPGAEIPFSFDGLLDWSKLQLSVSGLAAIGDNPTAAQIANAPAIREPAVNETALELPYRLVISPTADVAWLHRPQPFTSRGRTELWHTRLALNTPAGITELSKTDLAPLRAIWSPDYDASALPPVRDDPELGRTAMCGNDRHQIVVLTSAFHGYEVDRTLHVRKKRPITISSPYVPQPFHADRLMLSALGGWLRSRGQWDPPHHAQALIPRRPDFGEVFRNLDFLRKPQEMAAQNRALLETKTRISDEAFLFLQPKQQQLDLSEWVHLAAQGRDHYVKIVYEGELWPFRHPAALIKVTER